MRFASSIIFFFLLSFCCGKNVHLLQIECSDKPPDFFQKKLSYKTNFRDSLQASIEVEDLLKKLRSFGYLSSAIDSFISDSIQTHIYMFVGDKFEELVLRNGNVNVSLLGNAGVKSQVLNARLVSMNDVEVIKEKLIRECENNGYPFAKVYLDSFQSHHNRYSAKIFLQRNDMIRFDSINILGKTKMKRAFLKNYLGIKPGKAYNEANVKRIAQRLNELAFMESVQPHNVEFVNNKAKINVFLKDRKASDFDALIGFLPGSSGQKLLVTGQAHLHLISLFGMGEDFFLEWKKLQPKTQQLDVRISYPYLAGLPLGLSARFELYKRDTSYIDLNGDYGIQYQIIGSSYLKASLHQHITIVTNVDTSYIKSTRSLPSNLDINSNEFALEYYLQKLNYRFNPTSGFVLKVDGSIGIKKTKTNNNISTLHDEKTGNTFNFLYDNLQRNAVQFHFGIVIEKYWKLAARHTIKTAFDGKYFFSRNILGNEKYRIGGINSLRGFDDQSIFTPYYALANLEYRFLLSKNSYFSAFFNSAIVEDTRLGKKPIDFPFGFGVGAAIETKIGIFGISYAMGRQLENKINIKSAKIHFGYVNFF